MIQPPSRPIALAMTGASYQAVAARADKRNYPPPGQLVDVGGYQLHIYCQGEGNPTVLLDEAWSAEKGTSRMRFPVRWCSSLNVIPALPTAWSST